MRAAAAAAAKKHDTARRPGQFSTHPVSEPAWAKPIRPGERGWGHFAQEENRKSDDVDVRAAGVTPRYSTGFTSDTPIVSSHLGEISPLGEIECTR